MDVFFIYMYICLYGFHDANTKYEIVTAGLSVYGLTQAPRLHFSLHVVSIVIFSLISSLNFLVDSFVAKFPFIVFIRISYIYIIRRRRVFLCTTSRRRLEYYSFVRILYMYLFIPMIERECHLLFV